MTATAGRRPSAPQPLTRPASRRQALAGGAALALGALLAGCGGGGEGGGAAREGGGPWRFTDDLGRTATRPARPTRIVAQVSSAAALWELGIRPVGIFGPSQRPDGSRDPQVGAVDTSKVTSLGNEWGEFNLERLVALRPDLVVTVTYLDGKPWYLPDEARPTVERLAPIVMINARGVSAEQVIERHAELARSLGADLDAPAVTEARARFERAGQELAAAAKALKGLRVAAVSGQPDGFYVATPEDHPTLAYYRQLGLDIVVPEGDEAFYETLSWEQADKYPADAILYDARTGSMTLPDMKKKATFARLPAVRAGQVIPWQSETPFTYRLYAQDTEELTRRLRRFRADIVP